MTARGSLNTFRLFFKMAWVVIGDDAGVDGRRRQWLKPGLPYQELIDVYRPPGQSGGGVAMAAIRHLGPDLMNSGCAGGAGGDQPVELTAFESLQTMAQQFLKGGQITAGQGRNTAAALVFRQIDPNAQVIEDLDGTVGNGGKHFYR